MDGRAARTGQGFDRQGRDQVHRQEQDMDWQTSFPALARENILVTGGGGFIGAALVRALLRIGAKVTVLGRHAYPELAALGASCLQADIRDAAAVQKAAGGVGCVFHVAARAGIWGPRAEYMAINLQGSRNVLAACRREGVPVLVHTSTPSVVFDRKDLAGADEEQAYATQPLCAYAASKIPAEQAVLAANGASLKTAAIRPHLVWGPGDRNLIPRLAARARAGKLAVVGRGSNMVDITYIDNAVYAHLLAGQNLLTSATAAGQAFFIGQEKPVNLWQWINALLLRLRIPQVTRRVPLPLAYGVGAVLELAYTLAKSPQEPGMTRFLALQLARSHWFSHARAERLLGYRPLVDTATGVERLLAWMSGEGLVPPR